MGTNYNPRIVTDGLVLCLDAANRKSYPGTGTAWADLSGTGNNGTLSNVTYNNGYMVFNGTTSVSDHGTTNTLNLTSAISIDAWFRAVGIGEGGFARIVDRSNNSVNGYVMYLLSPGRISYTTVNSSVLSNLSPAETIISLNTWTNITATQDGTSASIYKNGVLIFSGSITSIPSVSTGFYVGNRAANDITFDGDISSVKIYNRALSPIEIQQNFNALRGRYAI